MGIVDAPFVDDPDTLEQLLEEWESSGGLSTAMSSKPDAYLFPRMLLVTGPLHQGWNAYKRTVVGSPGWDGFLHVLSSFLSMLGHKGLVQRFLRTCLPNATAAERRLFHTCRRKVVDWKWGYMSDSIDDMSRIIEPFLTAFDLKKFATATGHLPSYHSTFDLKAAHSMASAKARKLEISAEAEAHKVFSKAVQTALGWFGGCSCHDHIWYRDALANPGKSKRQHRDFRLADTDVRDEHSRPCCEWPSPLIAAIGMSASA